MTTRRKHTERGEESALRLERPASAQQCLLEYRERCEQRIEDTLSWNRLRPLPLLDQRREKVTMLQDQRARQSERKKRLGKIALEQAR